ncbi:hypothetical protein TNCV_250431 [Trichonephila clavipes]|nr:hypothetical protein TNCV_250431 [Trichonephila clavipes]
MKFQLESFLIFAFKVGQRVRRPTTKNCALQATTISGVANVNRPLCNGWSQLGEASFMIKAFPVPAEYDDCRASIGTKPAKASLAQWSSNRVLRNPVVPRGTIKNRKENYKCLKSTLKNCGSSAGLSTGRLGRAPSAPDKLDLTRLSSNKLRSFAPRARNELK